MIDYNQADKILDQNASESYHTLKNFNKNSDFDGAIEWVKEKTGCDDDIAKQLVQEFFDIPRANIVSPDIVVECPYCHNKSTTKITATAKVVNTAMFGLFGNKRKHQWHCNNCKADF